MSTIDGLTVEERGRPENGLFACDRDDCDEMKLRLAAAEARIRELEGALRHAARELQYVLDSDPCDERDVHQTGEGRACVALAETLLGPMQGWPEEPNAGMAALLALVPPPGAAKKGGE